MSNWQMKLNLHRKKRWLGICTAIIAVVAVLVVIAAPQQQNSALAGADNGYYGKKAKYVFYFIGDGLAMPQINSAEIFKGTLDSAEPMNRGKLNFVSFPNYGTQTTQAANTFITESAAAGTALATVHKTNNDVLGMDPGKTVKLRTMAEMAKEKGMKVGIVSTVSLDHATPAAFYAHQPSRSQYYEIGLALADSGFDYFAGGGLLAPTGKNKDKTDVLAIAQQKGFKIVQDKDAIDKLNKNDGRVIAIAPNLADESAMKYDIDRTAGEVSLADFTRKGIEVLDNPNGFFMMVEGGKVDWSCHANDAATTVQDVLAFEQAIQEALRFYAQHPDETLIVVTGDHETGGMTIGFAGTGYNTYFNKLSGQTLSFEDFTKQVNAYRQNVGAGSAKLEDWLPLLSEKFGLQQLTDYESQRLQAALTASMVEPGQRVKSEENGILYGSYDPFCVTVTHIMNQRAGIGWTTYAHTGVSVPVFAQGVGGQSFQGVYDNTDTAKKIMSIMGVAYQP